MATVFKCYKALFFIIPLLPSSSLLPLAVLHFLGCVIIMSSDFLLSLAHSYIYIDTFNDEGIIIFLTIVMVRNSTHFVSLFQL